MPTRHRGPEKEVRALNAFITLLRAAESVTARLQVRLDESSVTVGQFGALEALYHLGPMRPNELARKLLRSPGNMTTVLDNLEKRGLAVRKRETDDRRCVTVHLTDAGRRLMQRIFPKHVADVVHVFGVLTAAEQEELRRLCRALGIGERK
ncbi:MAG TPA: MarR family transcriptional regulator [Gemmataceae bacterium]|nr:MarR family transcriptional regulator [Gemmataceae bacterium]